MKKRFLIILLFIICLFQCGCTNKGFKEISYSKLKEKVDNKETFALFIGRKSCTSCDTFKDVLNELYAKEYANESTIFYIDLDKLDDDEFNLFNSKYDYEGTPTVTIIINGKFSSVNSVEGSNCYNEMINLMKKRGLLKGYEEEKEEKDEGISTLDMNDDAYVEISYSTLKEKEANKEMFILFIGRDTCSSCKTFKSILKYHYKKEYSSQTKINYIDLDKLTKDELNEFNLKYKYQGTPTVTILENGIFSLDNSLSGTSCFSDMINLMKQKELLKG